jgi:hypothetical protein
MKPVPPAQHLLRAKDLIDARYRKPLDVPALARALPAIAAHFSRGSSARSAARRTGTC